MRNEKDMQILLPREEALEKLRAAGVDLIEAWTEEGWQIGQYAPSQVFKDIEKHACVCRADKSLVAITGEVFDIEAQKQAELFAVAPQLVKAIEALLPYARSALVLPVNGEDHLPLSRDAAVKNAESLVQKIREF